MGSVIGQMSPVAAAVLFAAQIACAPVGPGVSSTPIGHASCGGTSSFRWPVKTAADADVEAVKTTPQSTSVLYLKKVIPPTDSALNSTYATDHRLNSFELSTWQTTATLATIDLNLHDSDLHITLVDSAGHKLTAEVPSPGCVLATSPFLPQITEVRNYLDKSYPTSAARPIVTVNRTASVTGLGFFDHSETAGSSSYYHTELHPVIRLAFR